MTFAVPKVMNPSSIRCRPLYVSESFGRYAESWFSTCTQFRENTENTSPMATIRKIRFRLSTIEPGKLIHEALFVVFRFPTHDSHSRIWILLKI